MKTASFIIIILTTTLPVSSIQNIIVGKGPRGRIVHRAANYNSNVWGVGTVHPYSGGVRREGGYKAGGRSPPSDLTQSLLAPNGQASRVIPSSSINTHCYTELSLPITIQAIHTLTYADRAQVGHVEAVCYLSTAKIGKSSRDGHFPCSFPSSESYTKLRCVRKSDDSDSVRLSDQYQVYRFKETDTFPNQ